MKMRSAVTLVLVALFVVPSVAVLAPMTVYAAPTGVPTLDAHFCKATLHGTWTGKTRTCTIGYLHVDSSIGDFTIPSKVTLAISVVDGTIGGLTIDPSVIITNYGVISNSDTIENYGTINNFGTINNCGTFNNYGTIANYGAFKNSGTINNSGVWNGLVMIDYPSCQIS
jgi:hypothetical protein